MKHSRKSAPCAGGMPAQGALCCLYLAFTGVRRRNRHHDHRRRIRRHGSRRQNHRGFRQSCLRRGSRRSHRCGRNRRRPRRRICRCRRDGRRRCRLLWAHGCPRRRSRPDYRRRDGQVHRVRPDLWAEGEEAGASAAGTSRSRAGARRGWAGTYKAAWPYRSTGCGRRCTGSGPPR